MYRPDSSTTPLDRDPRIHRDPFTGRLVIVAPERAERPIDSPADFDRSPAADCPFCAGNERLTPPDVLRAGDGSAWTARIIPNRFPFVRDLASHGRAVDATHGGNRPAHGVHEVVIESPRHERSILAIEPDHWNQVWRLCRDRLAMLSARRDLAWATIFKNSGVGAGASLEHVHSQLVAIDFVPELIMAEIAHAAGSPDAFGGLLLDADNDGRLIESVGNIALMVPPAARQPFEAWIVPRQQFGSFADAGDDDVAATASLLRSFVARLERLVPQAHFNWWLHQSPFRHGGGPPCEGYRWHVEIVPRLAALAGFELGAGCHISTLDAADSARLLREA